MSSGLQEHRARRRRRFWWGVVKWIFTLAVFVAIGAYAYYAGSDLARREVSVQEARVAELEQSLAELEERKAVLDTKLRVVFKQAGEWKSKYEREIPTGEMKAFMEQIGAKLDQGLSAKLLTFIIDSASEPRECEELPTSKRFIVRTALQSGANDSVSFDNNKVTVTAEGESAVNEDGAREAWFDINKTLKVSFTEIGGKVRQAEGLLPLHHSLITGSSEYRFALTPGARGFVNVAGQRCAYP